MIKNVRDKQDDDDDDDDEDTFERKTVSSKTLHSTTTSLDDILQEQKEDVQENWQSNIDSVEFQK